MSKPSFVKKMGASLRTLPLVYILCFLGILTGCAAPSADGSTQPFSMDLPVQNTSSVSSAVTPDPPALRITLAQASDVSVEITNSPGGMCLVTAFDETGAVAATAMQPVDPAESVVSLELPLPDTPAVYTMRAYLMDENMEPLCISAPKTAPMYSKTASSSRVSGVFIAPRLSSRATQQQWYNALSDMKALGVDTVIIQYACECDPSYGVRTYFPYGEPDGDVASSRQQQIQWILSAASTLEMQAYLGLQLAETEWFHQDMYQDVQWLRTQCQLSAQLADALWDAFGQTYRGCISGWYLPFEVESSQEYHPYYRQITEEYYAPLTSALKSHSEYGNLDIMISPMSCRTDDIDIWQDAARLMLTGAQIDIFAPQDGIGYGTQTHDTIGRWFQANRQAVDAARAETGRDIALWANCENYARLQNPNEFDPIERRKPMSIGKFIQSLDLVAPYVEKLITFSIHRWDVSLTDSSDVEVNRSYLEAYRRFCSSGIKPTGIAEGYYVSVQPVESDAALTLNRFAQSGLTDGFAVDSDDWVGYRGIGSPEREAFTMEIRFDDPVEIRQIESHYLAAPDADIGLPEKVEYEYFIRAGKNDDILTYTSFYVDTFPDAEKITGSIAALATPTVVDGIRITVFPGCEWTFMDEIWVE